MIYLGQPYTHPDPKVVDTRYLMGMAVAAWFASKDTPVYSPIMHWHACARNFTLPTDAQFWKNDNEHFLARSDEVHVLMLPDFEMSKGLRNECKVAARMRKPLFAVRILQLPYDPVTKKISLPVLEIASVPDPTEFCKLFAPDEVIEAYYADYTKRNSNGGSDREADEGREGLDL
jgi:hypothetical protein